MSQAVEALREAGIALDPERPLPFVEVQRNERGQPVVVGETLCVRQGEAQVELALPPVRQLLTGEAPAPDFSEAPEPRFALLFAAVEGAVADYCSETGRRERDREIQRIYRRLRDRPDGKDPNPLYSHLRAALRVILCLTPLSPAEYEAVLDRLATSARRLAVGQDSSHYLRAILETLEKLAAHEASPPVGPAPGDVAGEASQAE